MNTNPINHYHHYLMEQYRMATGSNHLESHSQIFMEEFYHWLKIRQRLGFQYTDLLTEIGIDFSNETCAEIGKGDFDSIIKPPSTTILITPYKDITPTTSSQVIPASFSVQNGSPTLDPSIPLSKYPFLNELTTYITQNPYTPEQIANWYQLHNIRNFNIAVGIFGKNYDKDIRVKLQQLKELKARMNKDIIEERCYIGENYFHVVASKPKIKKKIL